MIGPSTNSHSSSSSTSVNMQCSHELKDDRTFDFCNCQITGSSCSTHRNWRMMGPLILTTARWQAHRAVFTGIEGWWVLWILQLPDHRLIMQYSQELMDGGSFDPCNCQITGICHTAGAITPHTPQDVKASTKLFKPNHLNSKLATFRLDLECNCFLVCFKRPCMPLTTNATPQIKS